MRGKRLVLVLRDAYRAGRVRANELSHDWLWWKDDLRSWQWVPGRSFGNAPGAIRVGTLEPSSPITQSLRKHRALLELPDRPVLDQALRAIRIWADVGLRCWGYNEGMLRLNFSSLSYADGAVGIRALGPGIS